MASVDSSPMRGPFAPLSRRTFFRRALAVPAAMQMTPMAVFGKDAPGTDEAAEPRLKLRSHHPGGLIKNSEQLIEQMIMKKPRPRKISEQIFASSLLENVFLIDFGRHSILIDTGFDHQVHHHLDNLESLGQDLSKVVAILGTHSHVDHTAGLSKARERLGVPVVAHSSAIKPITTGDLLQTAAVIPEVKGWEFDYPACPIDETLDHGDVIQIGEERMEVLHIPGHTPDSLGYLWKGHFFTGDAVFGGGRIGWAHERWFSNYTDHAETMFNLIRTKPDARQFYSAHGVYLPWSTEVPEACIKTLQNLIARKNDPCNTTPRSKRRSPGDTTRVLTLPNG